MTITAGGQVTVQDDLGNTLVPQIALVPIADTAYLYGSGGELQDPCWGLFTFRITDANAGTQQDVFVTFMDRAILFSSFKTSLPLNQAIRMTICTERDSGSTPALRGSGF